MLNSNYTNPVSNSLIGNYLPTPARAQFFLSPVQVTRSSSAVKLPNKIANITRRLDEAVADFTTGLISKEQLQAKVVHEQGRILHQQKFDKENRYQDRFRELKQKCSNITHNLETNSPLCPASFVGSAMSWLQDNFTHFFSAKQAPENSKPTTYKEAYFLGKKFEAEGDEERAKEAFALSYELNTNPQTAEEHFQKAIGCYWADKYDEMRTHLVLAKERAPAKYGKSGLYAFYLSASEDQGDNVSAFIGAQEAIRLGISEPVENAKAHLQVAYSYLLRNDIAKSRRFLDKAEVIHSKCLQSLGQYNALKAVHVLIQNSGDYQLVSRYVDRSIKKDPHFMDEMILLFRSINRADLALSFFKNYVASTGDTAYYYAMGFFAHVAEQHAEALDYYRQAVQADRLVMKRAIHNSLLHMADWVVQNEHVTYDEIIAHVTNQLSEIEHNMGEISLGNAAGDREMLSAIYYFLLNRPNDVVSYLEKAVEKNKNYQEVVDYLKSVIVYGQYQDAPKLIKKKYFSGSELKSNHKETDLSIVIKTFTRIFFVLGPTISEGIKEKQAPGTFSRVVTAGFVGIEVLTLLALVYCMRSECQKEKQIRVPKSKTAEALPQVRKQSPQSSAPKSAPRKKNEAVEQREEFNISKYNCGELEQNLQTLFNSSLLGLEVPKDGVHPHTDGVKIFIIRQSPTFWSLLDKTQHEYEKLITTYFGKIGSFKALTSNLGNCWVFEIKPSVAFPNLEEAKTFLRTFEETIKKGEVEKSQAALRAQLIAVTTKEWEKVMTHLFGSVGIVSIDSLDEQLNVLIKLNGSHREFFENEVETREQTFQFMRERIGPEIEVYYDEGIKFTIPIHVLPPAAFDPKELDAHMEGAKLLAAELATEQLEREMAALSLQEIPSVDEAVSSNQVGIGNAARDLRSIEARVRRRKDKDQSRIAEIARLIKLLKIDNSPFRVQKFLAIRILEMYKRLTFWALDPNHTEVKTANTVRNALVHHPKSFIAPEFDVLKKSLFSLLPIYEEAYEITPNYNKYSLALNTQFLQEITDPANKFMVDVRTGSAIEREGLKKFVSICKMLQQPMDQEIPEELRYFYQCALIEKMRLLLQPDSLSNETLSLLNQELETEGLSLNTIIHMGDSSVHGDVDAKISPDAMNSFIKQLPQYQKVMERHCSIQ